MCGIAGYIGNEQLTQSTCERTLSLMKQRGPDFQDYVLLESNDTHVSLLHSRLSIIDLDERSNQPFKRKHCTLTFNGEIYNYLELRNQLKKQGVELTTNSDTEVLIEYYLLYGEKCVEHFEGMWAFAIYDEREKKLFLSRDRFAEKPLHYYKSNTGFYFGSEIKQLESLANKKFTVNEKHLYRYLVNSHKSLFKTEEGWYKEVKQLAPGESMVIDFSLNKEKYSYWKPDFAVQQMTMADAIEGTRYHMLESMKIRLRSDVPLAFCLSGGVDSASLASIAAKEFGHEVVSFSIIDKDKRYNELDNIQATIDDIHCKNIQIELSPEDNYLERLKNIIAYHDAPVATISYLVHSVLSEKISEHGYKVAFSGTGADEIFTGYYDHYNLHLHEMRNHENYSQYLKDWQEYPAKFVRNPFLQNPDLYLNSESFREHIYLNNEEFSTYLKSDFNEAFTEKKYNSSLLRNRMLNELFHEVVRVILNEDDLNSMMYSIENRSPYLDSKLVKFAYSIPTEHLIKNGYAKYVLREALNGILNDKVRLSREKKGFNASINSVIDITNPAQREYLLADSPVYDLIEKKKIEQLLQKGEYPNSFKKFLFNFINVKLFLENK